MKRLLIFLLGFGLMIIGFTYIITYLNLLSIGYSYKEYLIFILGRLECQFSIIGFFLVTVIIFTKGTKNNGIHL